MKTHVQKFLVVFLMGIVLVLSGCHGGDNQSPTSTLSQNSDELSNFWANEGNYKNISAYVADTFFRVFVPKGDYLIRYTKKRPAGEQTYYVAFRATKSASVTIGIHPERPLTSIWLQKGKINTSLGYVWPSGPVTLYSWPGFTSPSWEHVFTPNPYAEEMLLYLP